MSKCFITLVIAEKVLAEKGKFPVFCRGVLQGGKEQQEIASAWCVEDAGVGGKQWGKGLHSLEEEAVFQREQGFGGGIKEHSIGKESGGIVTGTVEQVGSG